MISSEKPIIGISVDCVYEPENAKTRGKLTLNWNYAEQVTAAGGVPILIPPMADMASVAAMVDGWLIPGGDDINPAEFGQELHSKAELQDPRRFEGESKMYWSLPSDAPVFGICYGCQFLNVMRGGDLIQHLPDRVAHEEHGRGGIQNYEITPDSLLSKIFGASTVKGKSFHHQAIDRIGTSLKVVAQADDGTIEAIEDPTREFFIALQWHPERTEDFEETERIFKRFIDEAKKYRLRRLGRDRSSSN